MRSKKYSRWVVILMTLVGIIYNSWPLGYILNPSTARYGLASDLNGSNQPYGWVFMLGDCVVGLLILSACLLMGLSLRGRLRAKTWTAIFAGLIVFGLMTSLSVFAPSSCHTSDMEIPVCASFGGRALGPDAIESTLAALGLLASLVGANVLGSGYKLSANLRRWTAAITVLWSASGILFLVAAAQNSHVHLAQQALLIMTGLSVFIVGVNVGIAIKRSPQ